MSASNRFYEHRTQGGFTTVELLVVISVSAMISVAFLGVVANYLIVITRNSQLTEMTVNSQNLLRSTVENIRLGDGVRQTNSLSGPGTAVGAWSTDNANFVIIIAVPALDSARQHIIDDNTGDPYMNEIIYYKSGGDLMARRLAHPDASGNTMVTTCAPASATPACPADTKLAEHVSSMVFTLYDQNGAATNTATDATSVKITLDMRRDSLGEPVDLTTNMRVTLRNRF